MLLAHEAVSPNPPSVGTVALLATVRVRDVVMIELELGWRSGFALVLALGLGVSCSLLVQVL